MLPPAPVVPTGGPAGPWTLAWDDDFDGNKLGPAWTNGWFPVTPETVYTYRVSEPDLACNASTNVAVADSHLVLRVTDADGCPDGLDYAGGLVSTIGTVEFLPGDYVEARLRIDTAKGTTANAGGFWTNGHEWPYDGEIDVVEFAADGPSWNIHDEGRELLPGHVVKINDPGGWHIYGAHRNPEGYVDYYYDGALVGSAAFSGQSPHYLILSLTLNEWSEPKVPGTMSVDWVRLYRR